MRSLYLGLFLVPSLVSAYSFEFNSAPRQCQNLSISITGSGSPPYNLLIIPVGPTPLPNSVEARKITQYNFTGTENTLSSQLKFPENSQFVAVVCLCFASRFKTVLVFQNISISLLLPRMALSCSNAEYSLGLSVRLQNVSALASFCQAPRVGVDQVIA